ncbi:MAG: hypothetical protein JWO46_2495 [Nocardioidaceae bacterium]|nr:hypothetical protein [Nocardioidaceae bacterium]
MRDRVVGPGIGVLALLLVLGAFLVTKAPASDLGGDAAAYVPPDGMRAVVRGDQGVTVTENARLPLGAGLFSAPGLMAKVLFLTDEKLLDEPGSLWRQTTTSYDGTTAQQSGYYAVLGRGVVQLGARLNGVPSLVFDPPLLVLPARIERGRTWTQHGDAVYGGVLTYESTTRISKVTSRCTTLSSSIVLKDKSGATLLDQTEPERWCRGRGSVSPDARSESVAARPGDVAPPGQALDLAGAGDDTLQAAQVVSDDGAYGEAEYTFGRVETAPARMADGAIHVADTALGDVLVMRRTGAKLSVVAHLHPGGKPTSLTAVGNVSVVATSTRQLCGYTSSGAWLWCRPTPDVVDLPGVRVGEGRVALLALDGRLRLYDARTGRRVWTADAVIDPRYPPVLSRGRVVTVSREGVVAAWRAQDGKAAWQTTVDSVPDSVGADDDRIVVSAASVSVLDGKDGAELGYGSAADIYDATLVLHDGIVQSGSARTRGLDRTAEHTRWSAQPLRLPITDGRSVIGVRRDEIRLLDNGGKSLAAWPSPVSLDGTFWVVQDGDALVVIVNTMKALVLS